MTDRLETSPASTAASAAIRSELATASSAIRDELAADLRGVLTGRFLVPAEHITIVDVDPSRRHVIIDDVPFQLNGHRSSDRPPRWTLRQLDEHGRRCPGMPIVSTPHRFVAVLEAPTCRRRALRICTAQILLGVAIVVTAVAIVTADRNAWLAGVLMATALLLALAAVIVGPRRRRGFETDTNEVVDATGRKLGERRHL